jgi:hypothetical protein
MLALIYYVLSHQRYESRMRDLGYAVIAEAEKVKADYPDEYPAYRAEAEEVLASHGVGYLAVYLP